MPQLTLFEPGDMLLADDERGRITYTPRFVDTGTAEAWFAELRSAVKWRAEGATRRMTVRAKAQPRTAVHVDLEPGSLLVMDYATQLHYTHGVPKTTQPVGERISLAFRVKQPRGARY